MANDFVHLILSLAVSGGQIIHKLEQHLQHSEATVLLFSYSSPVHLGKPWNNEGTPSFPWFRQEEQRQSADYKHIVMKWISLPTSALLPAAINLFLSLAGQGSALARPCFA
ncbi:hypothetical protein GQ54DRAFT_89795 [Martensiomyces pterosporus]|nr:hypothetical protein GQ54DRAFT_89795 [Martensiomyces pterosporus]